MDGKIVGKKGVPSKFGRDQNIENLESHIKKIDLNPVSDGDTGGPCERKDMDSLYLGH